MFSFHNELIFETLVFSFLFTKCLYFSQTSNHVSHKLRNDVSVYKASELEATFIEICNPKKHKLILLLGVFINIQIWILINSTMIILISFTWWIILKKKKTSKKNLSSWWFQHLTWWFNLAISIHQLRSTLIHFHLFTFYSVYYSPQESTVAPKLW